MAAYPAPDQLVAGRYQWRDQLGRGGFGVVWRAHDTLLQRDVAVKVIEFSPILDEGERAAIRKRVLREARAAARLNHPGLVTVFDVVEEDGRPLIVMELVQAPTLAALVERHGPLPDERAATIALSVLEALEVAHRQGIIHRDVKPANVMVAESGHVQLGDFGIAAVLDDPRVTSSGALAGSPSYMSPEQAGNQPPSAATDLWGLGATLYFAIEGVPPFGKTGAIATLTAVVNEAHRPLARQGPLATLIDELLAKDPSARPSTSEVRRRLEAVVAGSAPAALPDDPSSTVELDPAWAAKDPVPDVPAPGPPDPVRTVADANPDPDAHATFVPPVPAHVSPHPGGRSDEPLPPPRAPARGRRDSSRSLVPLLAVIGVVLLGLVVVALVAAGRDTKNPSTPASAPTTAAAGKSSTGSTVRTGTVPKDWVAYTDPATGYSISYPPGWTVSTNGTLTDFRDPSSRAYLRVDHREPPGPSPEGAWYQFEPSFAASNPNYHRVQITPTTYRGFRAAVWEYTYSGGGADLHAVDLGFVTPSHGFALNFQAASGDWNRLQSVFDSFKAAFKAPAS